MKKYMRLTIFGMIGLAIASGYTAAAETDGSQASSFPFGAFVKKEILHSLSYEKFTKATSLTTGLKSYRASVGRIDDVVFRDKLGREIYFRGWNVSGTTKLAESGFKPFKTTLDAKESISRMADTAAPNLIRFLIAWEGTNPTPGVIDHKYLDDVAEQMREAISRKIYILIDYHQDLFSRKLFNQKSYFTGNGAPGWVIPASDPEHCGLICTSWAQHNITDGAVRSAFKNFWNNAEFYVSSKKYNIQDVYLWQLEKSLKYLKSKFSSDEFEYIVGVDPFNEPVDGGMGDLTAKQWENEKLWPFYDRVRSVMNQTGWKNKFVYAEPLVFWNTNAPTVPATGGQLLDKKPGDGFVFNTHFYDAGRQSVNLTGVDNATYFKEFDEIRKEGRYRQNPILLSEFGAPKQAQMGGIGREDTHRIIEAMYQASEASNTLSKNSRMVDFYVNPISGTQWQWDHYYDRHAEYMNGNASKRITDKDGWNGEDYSVVKNYSRDAVVSQRNIERAYPRRVQGDLMNFYFNNLAPDKWGKIMHWAEIRPQEDKPGWLGQSQFILVTWRGRRSFAPTEIVLPRDWRAEDLTILTEKVVYNGSLIKNGGFSQMKNEVSLASDSVSNEAMRVIVWDDVDDDESENSIHFALVVNQNNQFGEKLALTQFSNLQKDLISSICRNARGVIYLTGKMTN